MADIYLEKDLQSPAAVTAFDSDPTVFGRKYFDSGRHFLVSLTVANGNLVLQGEALRRADAICIWSGRPLFWGPQAKADTPGKAGGAWQGGYLMYFGSNVVRFVEHFEPKGVVLAGLSASGAEPLTKYQIERFKASLLALEPAEQGCRQGTGKGYENCPPARNERPVIFPRPRCRLKPNEGAGSKRRVAGVTFRL